MEIEKKSAGAASVISIKGHLDSRSAPAAQERILSLLPSNQPVLLDITDVTYLSSAGLRTMLLVYRQAQCVDSFIALVGLSAELRAILTATGFLRFFAVADSIEEGLELLSSAEQQEAAP